MTTITKNIKKDSKMKHTKKSKSFWRRKRQRPKKDQRKISKFYRRKIRHNKNLSEEKKTKASWLEKKLLTQKITITRQCSFFKRSWAIKKTLWIYWSGISRIIYFFLDMPYKNFFYLFYRLVLVLWKFFI